MQNYEILGHFYLGKTVDPYNMTRTNQYLMYDAKDLSTHAICVGMTGSGKTGLGISILEEAAMDNIPALILDPKGDMTNLMLTFPELTAEDFLPWMLASEAERKGLSLEQFAEARAEDWRQGLAEWDQDKDRIKSLRQKADFSIYTPGGSAGKSISILHMLDTPKDALLQDQEALQDYVSATVSSLLSLLGIDADPLQSRDHILLSNILLDSWHEKEDLNLESLIKAIAEPGITQIGVMPLETFYPKNDRMQLALRLNNLLASPQFALWLKGEPLDINSLLYSDEGKPRISILTLNHLDEQERMFFVSTFLNQVLSWVRSQSGTSSLRALLYMDEIFGYFPPVANPPSKRPLLSLLKQARAYGLGIVLATQNPVDIDYTGLSNIGTWFIGRLQTEQDKERLLDGLQTASQTTAQGLTFNRKELSDLLSRLPARTFLMNNIHETGPILFETRWCMSYLAGPLTRQQIALLEQDDPEIKIQEELPSNIIEESQDARPESSTQEAKTIKELAFNLKPELPAGIKQYYLAPNKTSSNILYQPSLYAYSETTFEDKKSNLFLSQASLWNTLIKDGALAVDWLDKTGIEPEPDQLETNPISNNVTYVDLPTELSVKSSFTQWSKELTDYIYRNITYSIFTNEDKSVVSKEDETKADFIIRLRQANRESRDHEIAVLKDKYEKKIASLTEKIRKAEQTVKRESDQAKQAKFNVLVSLGNTLLDTFVGKKGIGKGTLGKAATTARSTGRASQQSGDVARAEETLTTYQTELDNLETELERELELLTESYDHKAEHYEEIKIKPLKKNILIKIFALLWLPFEQAENDFLKPLF